MLVCLLVLVFTGIQALLTIPASLVLMEQMQGVSARLPLFLVIIGWLALIVFSAFALLRIALRRSLFVARVYLATVFGLSCAAAFLAADATTIDLLLHVLWLLFVAVVFFCIRADRAPASATSGA
ncbi:hypothetical protein DFR29_1413 [Tahibacter aquaticus]|uniref:Uncharacterized protein n=2 Tax=Tahibacter aquaticus TaxID=520092 RepID=A0A4R6YFG2_9GAMM|nr:hypothetical protein DFR29_1413 [Tahibacter aquaticus]